MNKRQESLRKNLLTKIHIHPRYKLIKEGEAWEEWLYLRFGVESSAKLSINELFKAIDMLEGRIPEDTQKVDDVGRAELKAGGITRAQNNKIYALAEELNWSFEAISRFVYRQCGFYVLGGLGSLEKWEATKVIVGMEKVLREKKIARIKGES